MNIIILLLIYSQIFFLFLIDKVFSSSKIDFLQII